MVSTVILSSLLVAAASVCAIPVPAGTALHVPEVNDSPIKPIAVRGVASHKTRPHHPLLPVIPRLSTRDVVSVKHQSTGSDKARTTSKTHVSESKVANPPAVNEASFPSGSIDPTKGPLHVVPVRNTEDTRLHSHLPSNSHTHHAHPHRRCSSSDDSSTDSHSRSHSNNIEGIPSLGASIGTSDQSGVHLSSAASGPSAQTKIHDALNIGLGKSGADITARPSGAGTNTLLDTNESADVGTPRNRAALSSAIGTHDSLGVTAHPTVDVASPPVDVGASILADVKSNTNVVNSEGQGHDSSCGHT